MPQLFVSISVGEKIHIGNDVVFEILDTTAKGVPGRLRKVKIGVTAPKNVPIFRKELLDRAKENGPQKSVSGGKDTVQDTPGDSALPEHS